MDHTLKKMIFSIALVFLQITIPFIKQMQEFTSYYQLPYLLICIK